jgi:hypothetical protein
MKLGSGNGSPFSMGARGTWRKGPFIGGLEIYVKEGSVNRHLSSRGPVGEPGGGGVRFRETQTESAL